MMPHCIWRARSTTCPPSDGLAVREGGKDSTLDVAKAIAEYASS